MRTLKQIMKDEGYLELIKRLDVVNKELSDTIEELTNDVDTAKKAINLTIEGLETIVKDLKELKK